MLGPPDCPKALAPAIAIPNPPNKSSPGMPVIPFPLPKEGIDPPDPKNPVKRLFISLAPLIKPLPVYVPLAKAAPPYRIPEPIREANKNDGKLF